MLKLYKPQIDELRFKQKMLSDAETMSYNHAYGGTIDFGQEHWPSWYRKWIGNDDASYFYRYLVDKNDQFVGEVAYHFDEEINGFMADVLVDAKYRNQGYGREGLLLLCQQAKTNGISVLYDNIASDNHAIQLFLKCGFAIIDKDENKVLVKKEL